VKIATIAAAIMRICSEEKFPELFFNAAINPLMTVAPKIMYDEARIPKMMTIRRMKTIRFA
jgi:hypothetical protein